MLPASQGLKLVPFVDESEAESGFPKSASVFSTSATLSHRFAAEVDAPLQI
jgi:hypothetical protein